MKTLHVETGRHLYGGPQQVLYLLKGLAARDHEAVLVCPPGSAIATAAADDGIQTVTIPCAGDVDLRFAWRLRAVLREARPDVVHCHSRRGADFLGGQAAAMEAIPAVVSRRVDNPESAFAAALRYRKFERIIAISAAIEAVLRRAGVEPVRIRVIRDAVDAERFSSGQSREALAAEFDLPPEAPLVAAAGQLIERKGQRYLLDAVAALSNSLSDLRLVIFGSGPLETALRDQARTLGIDDRVCFAGFRDDLDDFLGAFDLFVHSATAEGMGVVTLKAAAAGLPVVAFAAGGVPEAVSDGQTGVLVPPADTAALAAAIAELLNDSERRARYAREARRHAARFSVAAMTDAHLELYREVLDVGP